MKMRWLTALLLAAAALMATPALAFASVAAGGVIDVQIWPQNGQTIVITSVELPSGTSLPAVVRIPVVPGSTVEWAGEILGANVSGDIAAAYKLFDGQGGQYAEFTLTKSLRGQIDSVASTPTVSGTVVATAVDWVQSVDSTQTTFSVRIPSAVSDVKITPSPEGKPVANEQGEALYVLPATSLEAGDKQTVTLSYDSTPITSGSATPSANTIIIALVAGLVVTVAALAFVVRRQPRA